MGIVKRLVALSILVPFLSTTLMPSALGAGMPWMPQPGAMVELSPVFMPAVIKGITIHPDNPLEFDFIIHRGDQDLSSAQKQDEYKKLIKYFLASLAVPDERQWVNLSPYEKDRIIEEDFGKTEMGRDLLAQDYLLKQITSSLVYPEKEMGKEFWDKVFKESFERYGTTDVPVDTFNKVWILPDDALIYEKGNTAYVLRNHLKVMLAEDYVALKNNSLSGNEAPGPEQAAGEVGALSSEIMREIIIPALEKEVNEGKNFAQLRQVYSGMILAAWYKQALKGSLLGQIYADKAKVKGVDQDPSNNQEIYQRYVQAYKQGVYNFIKEDVDKYSNEVIPRKYFSGGAGHYGQNEKFKDGIPVTHDDAEGNSAVEREVPQEDIVRVAVEEEKAFDKTPPVSMRALADIFAIKRPDVWDHQVWGPRKQPPDRWLEKYFKKADSYALNPYRGDFENDFKAEVSRLEELEGTENGLYKVWEQLNFYGRYHEKLDHPKTPAPYAPIELRGNNSPLLSLVFLLPKEQRAAVVELIVNMVRNPNGSFAVDEGIIRELGNGVRNLQERVVASAGTYEELSKLLPLLNAVGNLKDELYYFNTGSFTMDGKEIEQMGEMVARKFMEGGPGVMMGYEGPVFDERGNVDTKYQDTLDKEGYYTFNPRRYSFDVIRQVAVKAAELMEDRVAPRIAEAFKDKTGVTTKMVREKLASEGVPAWAMRDLVNKISLLLGKNMVPVAEDPLTDIAREGVKTERMPFQKSFTFFPGEREKFAENARLIWGYYQGMGMTAERLAELDQRFIRQNDENDYWYQENLTKGRSVIATWPQSTYWNSSVPEVIYNHPRLVVGFFQKMMSLQTPEEQEALLADLEDYNNLGLPAKDAMNILEDYLEGELKGRVSKALIDTQKAKAVWDDKILFKFINTDPEGFLLDPSKPYGTGSFEYEDILKAAQESKGANERYRELSRIQDAFARFVQGSVLDAGDARLIRDEILKTEDDDLLHVLKEAFAGSGIDFAQADASMAGADQDKERKRQMVEELKTAANEIVQETRDEIGKLVDRVLASRKPVSKTVVVLKKWARKSLAFMHLMRRDFNWLEPVPPVTAEDELVVRLLNESGRLSPEYFDQFQGFDTYAEYKRAYHRASTRMFQLWSNLLTKDQFYQHKVAVLRREMARILPGTDQGAVKAGVIEGQLKTYEKAVELQDKIAKRFWSSGDAEKGAKESVAEMINWVDTADPDGKVFYFFDPMNRWEYLSDNKKEINKGIKDFIRYAKDPRAVARYVLDYVQQNPIQYDTRVGSSPSDLLMEQRYDALERFAFGLDSTVTDNAENLTPDVLSVGRWLVGRIGNDRVLQALPQPTVYSVLNELVSNGDLAIFQKNVKDLLSFYASRPEILSRQAEEKDSKSILLSEDGSNVVNFYSLWNREDFVRLLEAGIKSGDQESFIRYVESFDLVPRDDERDIDSTELRGGIDFNAANLNLQIKRDGAGVPLPVSQQDLEGIQIDGLVPVILNIQPATSVALFS